MTHRFSSNINVNDDDIDSQKAKSHRFNKQNIGLIPKFNI